MPELIENLLNFLTKNPGDLLYHLVLLFTLSMSIQSVLLNRPNLKKKALRRAVYALLLVLILQLFFFLADSFTWQGLGSQKEIVPPLDRGITILSFVLLLWAAIFHKPTRAADWICAFLCAAIIALFVFSFTAWLNDAHHIPFNNSWLDWSWSILGSCILIAAILLLLLQKDKFALMGLLFINLNLFGFLAHLLWGGTQGDYAGAVRLAQLVSFPLLPTLFALKAQKPEKSANTNTKSDENGESSENSQKVIDHWKENFAKSEKKRKELERRLNLSEQSAASHHQLLAGLHEETKDKLQDIEKEKKSNREKTQKALSRLQEENQLYQNQASDLQKEIEETRQRLLELENARGNKTHSENVNIGELLDESIDRISLELLEKAVNLQLDLPETLDDEINGKVELETALNHLLEIARDEVRENGKLEIKVFKTERADFSDIINIIISYPEPGNAQDRGEMKLIKTILNTIEAKFDLKQESQQKQFHIELPSSTSLALTRE